MKTQGKVHAPILKSGSPAFDLTTLPKCGAKTRAGQPCARYGNIRNGRCKLHGGMSTGPRRDVTGRNNPNYRSGLYTRESQELAGLFQGLTKDSLELLRQIG